MGIGGEGAGDVGVLLWVGGTLAETLCEENAPEI
jgi:hypothetical protein